MKQTVPDDVQTSSPNLATGYVLTKERKMGPATRYDLSMKIPGGGYCSTAEDLARFAIAIHNNQILSSATKELMFAPQKNSKGQFSRYSLGWQLANRGDVWVVHHAGSAIGYESILFMIPDKNLAVVLLANKNNVRLFGVADKLAKLVED